MLEKKINEFRLDNYRGVVQDAYDDVLNHPESEYREEELVGQLFNRYCKLMGTVPKSSHKARKPYISTLIDGGVNINTVREIVAHASEKRLKFQRKKEKRQI